MRKFSVGTLHPLLDPFKLFQKIFSKQSPVQTSNFIINFESDWCRLTPAHDNNHVATVVATTSLLPLSALCVQYLVTAFIRI